MPDPNRPLLSRDELLRGWTPRRIGRRILTLSETDSTNTVALAAANDPVADGMAVFADFQTAGRGRLGRSWLAPRGASILCSFLLLERSATGGSRHSAIDWRPCGAYAPEPFATCQELSQGVRATGARAVDCHTSSTAGHLTLASAVAACDAIRRATDVTPSIKWPNDLRVAGRKLAGILIESRTIDANTRAWVIGIGLNCYQHPGHFPPELRDAATSLDLLSAHPVDRTAVARGLLRSFDELLAEPPEGTAGSTHLGGGPKCSRATERFTLASHSPEAIHARWLAYAEPLGQRVRLRSNGRDCSGRTIAVDPAGGLILQSDTGRQEWFDPLLTTLL